jgi:hypothetical protein
VTETGKPRQRTPRVPANFLYNKLVPIAIGVMVVLLVAVLIAVLLPLLGLNLGYTLEF